MGQQDRATPFAETLEALDKLHKAGKFVRLGISNFTSFEVAEVCLTCKYNNWVRPTVYQGEFSSGFTGLSPQDFLVDLTTTQACTT